MVIETDGLRHIRLRVADWIEHFGLELRSKVDLDDAIREVEAAGGRVVQRGEYEPGHAYAYLADPDGYVFEL